MNISVFGLGYVGCVSLGCLAKNGHTVIGVDVNETKLNQINSGLPTIIEKEIDEIIHQEFLNGRISATADYLAAVQKSDVTIIAVGTPSSHTGHLNLNYIFNVAENIARAIKEKNRFHTIAIRSTVLPGTAEKFAEIITRVSGKKEHEEFAIVSNPEFLREGSAVYDYFHPPLTLIGANNAKAAAIISSLYQHLPAEIVITENKIAEMMKYVNNTFHALKISFANEVGNICTAMKIDSHKVMEIFCKDKELNISPYYLKPGFAYGGSCLPKDLKGMQTLAHDYYVETPLIHTIDKVNSIQINRAVELIQSLNKKRLAFLGLSFKQGTDDLRNSPAVTVIETLYGKGYEIKIYDTNVQLSSLTGTNKEYIDKRIPHLSALMVDNINDLFNNAEVIIINNKEKEYVDMLVDTETDAYIVDMVRLPDPVRLRENYIGINW